MQERWVQELLGRTPGAETARLELVQQRGGRRVYRLTRAQGERDWYLKLGDDHQLRQEADVLARLSACPAVPHLVAHGAAVGYRYVITE
ncbi:MAG TPA: hypothetical protein VFK80_02455, partial [Limnochordia bacterium]|nr:hypothetical protein [Limnochordia bacterium]